MTSSISASPIPISMPTATDMEMTPTHAPSPSIRRHWVGEISIALVWVVGYLGLLSGVGLMTEPMTGSDIGGNPLMNTLQNNLMIIVIAGLFGMIWRQAKQQYEQGLIIAAGVGVIGWFTYLQAPMLAGLYTDYGWWQTQLGLAPHMLLELGAFVFLVRNPRQWRWVLGAVLCAAVVETWLTPPWVTALGIIS